jgi:hypothetical protein
VKVDFSVPVSRLREGQAPDDETTMWVLVTPVVGGGKNRVWRRRLAIQWEHRDQLHEMTARVFFHDSSGTPRCTSWGPQHTIIDKYPELGR